MHKQATFLMLALSFLIFNCRSTEQKEEANLQRDAQLWSNVLNKGALSALDTNLHPDCVLVSESSVIRKKANVKAHYDTLLKAMSGVRFTIDEAFCEEDRIITRWTFTAFHTGNFRGITPTGKKISCKGASFERLKDGKIIERIEFMDHAGIMQQVQDSLSTL